MYTFFEQIFRKIKEIQPVSTTGALAHTYYWLTSFGSGDLVFRNPNFRAPKEHAPDLSEGIAIYCTHGTADQAGAFDRIAQRLIAAGLPELVSSIHLVSFDSRYQGKGINYFSSQLAEKIKKNGHKHVILIGHSRGCLVNTYAAERYLPEAGIHVERVINLCGPFGGSDLAIDPLSRVSTSVEQMQVNSTFLKKLGAKVMQSKAIYNFFAAAQDWIVRPAFSYVVDYVKKNPKALVELDRHGHLSIMSSYRVVGFIRDYIIESCNALLSPVSRTDKKEIDKNSDEEVVAKMKEELDDSDFIFVDKDEVEDDLLLATKKEGHKIVEESDDEGGYVLIDNKEIEDSSSSTSPRF
ncbi:MULTISPECIES: alpha/beta hydrolase [unclassified Legionella]|uniref:alpha/beta hydrolase n=1 Tax=unclassified Legionella TaxID=2622702 RepID=UPI001E42963F|nr:alpha/beta hydrolase [Legionella sp. 31fI33]MCC5013729.1 alpha/beta hydrolase [Legionella sp. 31fI33]